jgi:hypothetical protein
MRIPTVIIDPPLCWWTFNCTLIACSPLSGSPARLGGEPCKCVERSGETALVRRTAACERSSRPGLVSLELGGSNAITNLWPEHYYDPWGARTKDRLENRLHVLVCSGRLALAAAQRQEAANWIKAYKKYVR